MRRCSTKTSPRPQWAMDSLITHPHNTGGSLFPTSDPKRSARQRPSRRPHPQTGCISFLRGGHLPRVEQLNDGIHVFDASCGEFGATQFLTSRPRLDRMPTSRPACSVLRQSHSGALAPGHSLVAGGARIPARYQRLLQAVLPSLGRKGAGRISRLIPTLRNRDQLPQFCSEVASPHPKIKEPDFTPDRCHSRLASN